MSCVKKLVCSVVYAVTNILKCTSCTGAGIWKRLWKKIFFISKLAWCFAQYHSVCWLNKSFQEKKVIIRLKQIWIVCFNAKLWLHMRSNGWEGVLFIPHIKNNFKMHKSKGSYQWKPTLILPKVFLEETNLKQFKTWCCKFDTA